MMISKKTINNAKLKHTGISQKSKSIKKNKSEVKIKDNIVTIDSIEKYIVKNSESLCVLKYAECSTSLHQIQPSNILNAFLWPMDKAYFLENIYKKKALHIVNSPINRIEGLISEYLNDLDIKELLEDSASDQISVWFPAKEANSEGRKEIDSFKTDDFKIALSCHERGNASLYFQSSQEMQNSLCKQLSYQLGMNFAAYYDDYSTMGEIEIFVSKKGGYTDFHIDFQQNFTIQLKGSKKWFFLNSKLTNPVRGFTPHYKDSGNIEEQLKLHHNQGQYMDISKIDFSQAEEIVIKEGEMLYHPAGIWHAVLCEEDSIQMNISLRNITYADYTIGALKQLALRDDFMRSGIVFQSKEELIQNLEKGLNKLKETIDQLKTQDLAPNSLLIPRIKQYDISEMADEHIDQAKDLDLKHKYHFNKLACLLNTSKIPQYKITESSPHFILHINYGSEEYSSKIVVEIYAKNEKHYSIIEELRVKSLEDRERELLIEDFGEEEVKNVFFALIYNGFICD